jgi:hypothetical protein
MQPTFFPYNYLYTMYQRWQNWSQGSKSINEYIEEFYKLLTRVDLSESDEQLVSWFIGGLQPQIQDTLSLFDHVNVSAAYQRPLLIEKTLVQGSMVTFGRGSIGSYNRLDGSFANRGTTPPNGPSKATTIVGQPSRTGAAIGPKCFRCGEPGH